jgi:hypothetical protein
MRFHLTPYAELADDFREKPGASSQRRDLLRGGLHPLDQTPRAAAAPPRGRRTDQPCEDTRAILAEEDGHGGPTGPV